MFTITSKDTGEWIANVTNYSIEGNGVWIWMGFFENAEAQPIVKGMQLHYNDLDCSPMHQVGTVAKVNRVTVKLTNGKSLTIDQ